MSTLLRFLKVAWVIIRESLTHPLSHSTVVIDQDGRITVERKDRSAREALDP